MLHDIIMNIQEISLESVHILGVRVDNTSEDQLLLAIKSIIGNHQKAIISNVNINAMNLAFSDHRFRRFLNDSTINFCDGAGVRLAANLLGGKIQKRITYADWMWTLAEFADLQQFRFFFLGAKPGVAGDAAKKLKEKFPHIQIVGTHHGYFNHANNSSENEEVIAKINAAQPDILILGLGMPYQEYWLLDNWERINGLVALTGGAVFDYISGHLHRAPLWMTRHGLEWLGRLFFEPTRLWKRYLIGNPLFFWRVLVYDVLKLPLPH